jgi:hypothetical protein
MVFFYLWCGAGLNRRHMDFQSIALPTELPHHHTFLYNPFRGSKNKGFLFKIKDCDWNILKPAVYRLFQ